MAALLGRRFFSRRKRWQGWYQYRGVWGAAGHRGLRAQRSEQIKASFSSGLTELGSFFDYGSFTISISAGETRTVYHQTQAQADVVPALGALALLAPGPDGYSRRSPRLALAWKSTDGGTAGEGR